MTFGARYICIASLCREICRDEPCSESVVDKRRCRKANMVVLRLRRTSRAHWNPAQRFNARPTHKNISALPSCLCSMIHSNVHGRSKKDIIFCLLLQKHVKCQIITNEGGRSISRNIFIKKREWTLSNSNPKVLVRLFRQPQICKHFFFCEPTGSIM